MKKILIILGVFLIIILAIFFLKNQSLFPFKKNPTAMINGHTFNLLIASSRKEKEIGLSEKKSLPENQGMIFPFGKLDYYSFWMKDMKISIDIIYIDNDTIVTILSNIKPPANPTDNLTIYNSTSPADKVLEINSGLSEKYNFKKGDKIKYENLSN